MMSREAYERESQAREKAERERALREVARLAKLLVPGRLRTLEQVATALLDAQGRS